ncbi:hypothetical protein L1887_39045 [Cichorium endivia]|nr:hypothetical protein L1887_39045 [Cichorium endivia]
MSAKKVQNTYTITLIDGKEVPLDKKVFAAALHLPYHEAQFDHPSPHQLETMIYKMGYAYKLVKLYQLSKGNISPLWKCLIHYMIKCFTGTTGGTDQLSKRLLELLWSLFTGNEIDYAEIIFEDFLSYIPTSQKSKGKIHSARFWAICIEHLYQVFQIPIPALDGDKLEIPEAKPYAPKTDSVLGKLRRLPDSLLNLADPTEDAVITHIAETKDVSPYLPQPLGDGVAPKKTKKKASDPSPTKSFRSLSNQATSEKETKKDQNEIQKFDWTLKYSEFEKMEERQNSPESEDTQEIIKLVEKQNSPPKEKGKEKIIEKPKFKSLETSIPDRTQPPPNASPLDAWKFWTAANQQASLIERLKQQFELRNIKLQALSDLGPPSGAEPEEVKIERRRIKKITLEIDTYLSSKLSKLVDTPLYLFDTTKKNWAKIAS